MICVNILTVDCTTTSRILFCPNRKPLLCVYIPTNYTTGLVTGCHLLTINSNYLDRMMKRRYKAHLSKYEPHRLLAYIFFKVKFKHFSSTFKGHFQNFPAPYRCGKMRYRAPQSPRKLALKAWCKSEDTSQRLSRGIHCNGKCTRSAKG